MIIYGGNEERIKIQLKCKHKWYGPCIDTVSRYYKCTKCYCFDRDCIDEEDYWRLEKEAKEMEKI